MSFHPFRLDVYNMLMPYQDNLCIQFRRIPRMVPNLIHNEDAVVIIHSRNEEIAQHVIQKIEDQPTIGSILFCGRRFLIISPKYATF